MRTYSIPISEIECCHFVMHGRKMSTRYSLSLELGRGEARQGKAASGSWLAQSPGEVNHCLPSFESIPAFVNSG